MAEQDPKPVDAVNDLTRTVSNVIQASRTSFKVHKSLLKFAIPLSQFSNHPLNKDHPVHVSVIIVNSARDILIHGSRGLTPTGPVHVGVDKTLIEGVSRVVKETTGLGLSAIKAHLGIYHYPLISTPSPGLQATSTSTPAEAVPPASPSVHVSQPSTSTAITTNVQTQTKEPKESKEPKEPKKKVIVYSFLAIIEPQPITHPSAGVEMKEGWKWCSRTVIECMDLVPSYRKRLMTALNLIDNTGQQVRITPTRLIVPRFEVVKALKAYLLPLEVFRSLPPLEGKQLIASVAIVHPTERKILLVQRSSTDSWANHWEFPGGGSDPEDLTILHTAVREVKEETGLEIGRFKGLAGTFEIEEDGLVKARAYVFLAKIGCSTASPDVGRETAERGGEGEGEGGEVVVRLNPEEHQACMWLGSRQEVEGLAVPPSVKGVMMDLLDALNHTNKRDQGGK